MSLTHNENSTPKLVKFSAPKVIHGRNYETVEVIYDIVDEIEEKVESQLPPNRRKNCSIFFTILKLIIRILRWCVIGMFSSCIENLFVRFVIHLFTFILLLVGGYLSLRFVTVDAPEILNSTVSYINETVTSKQGLLFKLIANCYDPDGKEIKC